MREYVVVGVDGSVRGRAAADWAAREAESRGMPLRVVHVAGLAEDPAAGHRPACAEPLLERTVDHLTDRRPALRITGVRLTGDPVPGLLAATQPGDLLVLGTRGAGGFAGLPVGSVALGAAERAEVPVVLVPGMLAWSGGKGKSRADGEVAVGVDARAPADAALDFAFDAADRSDLRLRALHAWTLPAELTARVPFVLLEEDRAEREDQEVQLLADALHAWREKYPQVRVLEDVLLFSASDALVRASARAELVVVGRHGPALGRTAHNLVHHTKCPVAVVPS